MAASSGLFLATIYHQSQLTERKHVARYWSIDTAATTVPLSPHRSATTKLAAALAGSCSEEVFCRLSTAPVIALLLQDHRTMSVKSVCSSQYMVTW